MRYTVKEAKQALKDALYRASSSPRVELDYDAARRIMEYMDRRTEIYADPTLRFGGK